MADLRDGDYLAVELRGNRQAQGRQDGREQIDSAQAVARPAAVDQGRDQHVVAVQTTMRAVVRLVLEAGAQIEAVARAHHQVAGPLRSEELRDLPGRVRVLAVRGEARDLVTVGVRRNLGIAERVLPRAARRTRALPGSTVMRSEPS